MVQYQGLLIKDKFLSFHNAVSKPAFRAFFVEMKLSCGVFCTEIHACFDVM